MYKITGIRQADTGLILGYTVDDGKKEELLPVSIVYWLVKAGLIDNATAKENGDKLLVEVDTNSIPRIISKELQTKTEKVYEAIRRLEKNCLFNLNMEKCTVKIVGCAYKHIIPGTTPYKEMLIDGKNTLEIIGYEIKNTGNSLVYFNTVKKKGSEHKEHELNILRPGDTVLLSTYETKILLANLNVVCSNGYLVYDVHGVDLAPTVFEIDDDILVETTHEIERKVRFDHYPTTVLNRIFTPEELSKQIKNLETIA